MNIGGLVSALLPVFFVLALGYFAGKRNAFDADQAAGLSSWRSPSRCRLLCLSA
jgi:malonate transporter